MIPNLHPSKAERLRSLAEVARCSHPRLAAQAREEAHFRAQYYGWMARHPNAIPGNDPLTGRPRSADPFGLERHIIGPAAYAAMARAAYQIARAYGPTPLP